jgi:hypothetical protein
MNGMERVIATHRLDDHRLDVVESIDEDLVTVRLLVDGELLPPDVHPDRAPTAEEAASLLKTWLTDQPSPAAQVPNRGGLRAAEVIALLDVLDREQRAQATYSQVLTDFGDVMPFADIVDAVARQIDALTSAMHRYQVPVPANPWPGKVPRFDSVRAACAAAAESLQDDGALYTKAIAATDRADIRDLLRRIEEASQQRHLPALQRCAQGA